MNKEEYYLNQDVTSECILLPNLLQQGDYLTKLNYLSELSDNPNKVLKNLGLGNINDLFECCEEVQLTIEDIQLEIQNHASLLSNKADKVELLKIDGFIPINNKETNGSSRLPEVYIKSKSNITLDAENIYIKSKNFSIDNSSSEGMGDYYSISLGGQPFVNLKKKETSLNHRISTTYTIGNPSDLNTIYFQSQNKLRRLGKNNEQINLLEEGDLNNYLIKNSNLNQCNVSINCDSFNINNSAGNVLKFNGEDFITKDSNNNFLFKSNSSLYRDNNDGTYIIYDSGNFSLNNLVVNKSEKEGDIVKNNTSFTDAIITLESEIKNLKLPSSGSGECLCELPKWITNDEPDFGDKNIIEKITLNGEDVSISNKTVNINETITKAEDGLKIEGNIVKHTNSLSSNPPEETILCKIKFDKFGHIIGYSEVEANDLFDMLKELLDSHYEKNSDYEGVTTVKINESDLNITNSDNPTQLLTVTVNGTDKRVTWESSDPDVATVDDKGLVTGKSNGSTVITVISVDNPNAKDTITVNVNFPQIYYFSVGITPITSDNYTTANNATTTVPPEKLFSTSTRSSVYILIPSNKKISVVNNSNNNNTISITEQTNISIDNHKVYKTGTLNVGGTIKIQLS